MKRFLSFLLVLAVLAGGGYAWYVQRGPGAATAAKPAAGGRQAVPVVIQPAQTRPVPEQIATIGNVQPIASIAIKARVDTVVETVHFTEGQEVKAGDPLFTLDDRTLQAQLRQAQANLERDSANLEKARMDVERYNQLVKRDAIARSQYDTAVATAAALEGTVKADQAAIESARVALSYTRIHAPMAGRTGVVTAKAGANVRAGDATPLVTLTQLRPINVAFNIAERHLATIREAMAAGPLKVAASVPGRQGERAEGTLTFIDSQVDQQSGTILVKGEFANAEAVLWPGQFVDVVLTLRVEPQALTVPADAVQTGQEGRYVYVVKPDNTVELRTVTVARTHAGLAVVAGGLKAGEKVVVDGQSRLYPGAPVADRAPPGDKKGEPGGKAEASKAGTAGGPS
ncbi:efflux RND transporter periplasmic adaptor subunit [Azospirillum sp.]|uniref:efflux RND transporter periplasmic adaptor subunit n=1 Tax=Azospirillum sp. TaxID=34012 RepID=UPI002D48866C|nr:efflux RND transporter periplasmic adaptor subunit [Azospirillum sp.]HYD64126.1 efflux RND transporter periplasmic adaptor subunit [Azospirillum sp.]